MVLDHFSLLCSVLDGIRSLENGSCYWLLLLNAIFWV